MRGSVQKGLVAELARGETSVSTPPPNRDQGVACFSPDQGRTRTRCSMRGSVQSGSWRVWLVLIANLIALDCVLWSRPSPGSLRVFSPLPGLSVFGPRRSTPPAVSSQSANGAYSRDRSVVVPRPAPVRVRHLALWQSPFRTPRLIRDPVIIEASAGAPVVWAR
jgi:hypothetical protein